MGTIYELSRKGRRGVNLPQLDVPRQEPRDLIPEELIRDRPAALPEVSQPNLVRHYTRLSKMNYGVDDGLYPLGSCTMKYNPKINDELARLPQFSSAHPLQGEQLSQGALKLMFELGKLLQGIVGMAAVSMQPVAGAHGELVGMLLIKKYFQERGQLDQRAKILLPDSAHGTNPASARTAGFQVVQTKSDEQGMVDLDALRRNMDGQVAGIMLTVPNTLGIFEEDILKITEIVHRAGGLCYFDGANLNSILGRARPGDMGVDIVHFNLHKTFSTPHGGGGPGAGPVAVVDELEPYLPVPVIAEENGRYHLDHDRPKSIGRVHSFYGNFGVMVKAYAYIRMLGDEGLRAVSGAAVLNANYLQERLKKTYRLPYDRPCKHEFVLSGKGVAQDIHTLDIAKRLIDYGFHPPTVYFPLIVAEALMIEPTETVSKEELDRFIEAMERIVEEAQHQPELLQEAPHSAPVRRLDEVRAARKPILRAEPPPS